MSVRRWRWAARFALYAVSLAPLAAPALSPAQDLCTNSSGQWGYGRIFEVEVRDGLVYYTQGADLVIADVTEPGQPTELGRVNMPEAGFGLALGDGFAFAGCHLDLCVVNVADPTRPAVVARVPMPPIGVSDVVLNGVYLYALGWDFQVFDVTEPHDPQLISTLDYTQGRLVLAGSYAYMIGNGLRVLDIQDPAHPVEVGHQPLYARDLEVSGSHLFVVDSVPDLRVFDLANPVLPTQVGSLDLQGGTYSVAIADGHALLASSWDGLRVVSVVNPTQPVEVGFSDPPGFEAWSVAATADRRAFVGTDFGGLREVALDDPAHPQELGTYVPERSAWAVATLGDVAVVADRNYGLRLFDGPTGPQLQEIGNLQISMTMTDLAVIGHHAYLVGKPRLKVVDIADPQTPQLVAQPGVVADSIAVVGDLAVVAKRQVEVLNVSDPPNPVVLGSYLPDPPPGLPPGPVIWGSEESCGVAATRTHAFACIGYDVGPPLPPLSVWFTAIVDISDPSNPVQVGTLQSGPPAVYGNYLYVGWSDLEIFDVTDPQAPVHVASMEPPYLKHFTGPLQVVGTQMYVSDYGYGGMGHAGMFVLDLADPVHPMIVGDYRTGWDSSDVAVSNGRAYIADGLAGVHAVEIDACRTLFVDNLESGGTSRWSLAVP